MLCCHYLGGIGWIWGPSALSRPSACAHVGVYPHPYQVASQFQSGVGRERRHKSYTPLVASHRL
jgi:hypothetical protein